MTPHKPTTGESTSSVATADAAAARDRVRAWSVREIAERFGVKRQVVGDWIRFGELRAIDVRRPGAKRPRFKILPMDLSAFEAARANRGIADKVVVPVRRKQAPASEATPIGRRW